MRLKRQCVYLFLLIILLVCNSCSNLETITVVWPTYLVNMTRYTAEQQVELINKSNEDNKYANTVYANEDGSITIEMNAKQLQNNKGKFIKYMDEIIEEAGENEITINVSDDYKELTFEFSRMVDANVFVGTLASASCNVVVLQMLLGENPDDWHLNIKYINSDTGNVIKEGTIPDEELNLSPEDWEE